MLRHYPAFVHKDPESDFGVSFPDFPGCVTGDRTPEEAFALAEEALQFHVNGLLEDGAAIPEPMALDAAFALGRTEGALVVALVPVRLPGKAKRINVTIDEHLLTDIDTAAARQGMSRSAFLAEGARRLLGTG
ncbi:MAG: type II toxin-antitoxin system HicB family antitoxin [Myxococcales bacterium]|nr:type II toxin-antitoxin system HicB family antitoxin [Myxococcales bacterium]